MIKRDTQTEAFVVMREKGCTMSSEDWTEADTRSKFIDSVLFGCLGWSENDTQRELAQGEDRLDYLLSTSRPAAVLEAKRAGISLKVGKRKGLRRIRLDRLLKANPSLTKPVNQVADYCHRWSAPIAVLTNGRTYVFFLGSRTDGTPFSQGEAILLPDLFAPEFDFAEFHGLLSKDAVLEGRTLAILMQEAPPAPAESVVSLYHHPDAIVPRNTIGLRLEPLLKQVFTDVTREDSREVLTRCYVPPLNAAPPDREFEALLLDKPPSYVEAVQNVADANTYRKFQDSLKDYLTRQSWAQTLLVIGGVGVGKTFFLMRYFLNVEEDDTRRSTCAFYVDFRKPELDPNRVGEMIYRRLKDQIFDLDGKPVPGKRDEVYDLMSRDGLGQIFRSQIRQFEKLAGDLRESNSPAFDAQMTEKLGKLSDDDRAYVIGACRVLRDRYHRHVCVILDNADQCDPAYQSAVYLFSRTLEDELKCLVIVCLREEWYWHHGVRAGGPMSAYNDTVYHIPAAPIRQVLHKRLEYAVSIAEASLSTTEFSVKNVVISASQLATYLKVIHRAFLDDEAIASFYEAMSNGNTRQGLDIFLEFLRSGHTDAEEYLNAIVTKDNYTLRFHQVFKSVSCGSYLHYRSARSTVPNLVYPVAAATGAWQSYFARPYFLMWLSARLRLNSTAGTGFVSLSASRQLLTQLGLAENVQADFISELIGSDLIEPDVRISTAVDKWTHVRIMAKGFALVRRLPASFAYWEAAMLDTPITSRPLLERVRSLYPNGAKPSLKHRIEGVTDFLAFLQNEENLEQVRVRAAGLAADCPAYMPMAIEMSSPDFDRVRQQAKTQPFM